MSSPASALETPPVVDKSGPIRRFLDSGLQDAVDKALANIPQDKHGVAIAYANESAIGVATMARLSEGWSVVMAVEKPWRGKIEAQAAVEFQW